MNNILRGAGILAQSGGPTAVINSSAYGVIKTALEDPNVTRVLGAAHGIRGVLDDELYDMGKEDPYELSLLPGTPSSELGSVRYKMADPDKDDRDFKRILEIFKKYDVRYFFCIGGNDTMDTCEKISRFTERSGYECRVIGIPKTIDNDLFGTDHCPGFGSAAKYIATSCMEVAKDARVYDAGMITVMEIMGRHAGWLAGSAALAAEFGSGPDFICLPEAEFDPERFFGKVKTLYEKQGNVFVAVSEGVRDRNGKFISEYFAGMISEKDAFGHLQLGGVAANLAAEAKRRTGAKVRGIELSLLQRCASHLASKTDADEAFAAGKAAVESAVSGETGKMVAFERTGGKGAYLCGIKLVPLTEVANLEKKVPPEWITPEGDNVTKDFIGYVLPLIQGVPEHAVENSLPRYARLKKIRA